MARGRLRKAAATLKLEGNYRKDRHASRDENERQNVLPSSMPCGLNADGKAFWKQVIELRPEWIDEIDVFSLEMMARVWQQIQATSKLLDADPVNRQAGMAFESALAHCQRMAGQFGLTPSDRAKLLEAASITPKKNRGVATTTRKRPGPC